MSTSLPGKEVTFIQEDERIKPGQYLFRNNIAAERGPKYSTAEAAKFFNWSPSYLRQVESEGVFDLEREKGEWREFTLADIEDISYALADRGMIDYDKHRAILNAILNIAKIWRIV